jgi:hypothetical protein
MTKEELLNKKRQLLNDIEEINRELQIKDYSLPKEFDDCSEEERLVYLDYMSKASKVELSTAWLSIDCYFEKDNLKVFASFSHHNFSIDFRVNYLSVDIEFECKDINWAKELLDKILNFKEVTVVLPKTIIVPELLAEYWENEWVDIGNLQSLIDLTYENGVLKETQNEQAT